MVITHSKLHALLAADPHLSTAMYNVLTASVILFTGTFCANPTNSLTCSPSYYILILI